jgi:enamine deaminase RidA (YjgF/YER057c/UK114 family)
VADRTPEQRLAELGLELPTGSAPVGRYLKVVRWDDLLFLSGHGPVQLDGSRVVGKVGNDLDKEAAYQAARLVGLGLLSTMRQELGELGRVVRVLKLLGMVNATPGFTEAPAVVNGCSDLLLEVLGDDIGRHARSAVCVAELPFGIPVEIEAVVAVRD